MVLLDGTRVPEAPWQQAAALLDAGFATDDSVGRLGTGGPASPEDATENLASGPLGSVGQGSVGQGSVGQGSAGQGSATVAGASALERVGPWTAVGVAGLVVLAGAALAVRSRR